MKSVPLNVINAVARYNKQNAVKKAQKKMPQWYGTGGQSMIRNITQEDFGTLAICAIRYCQGRETYMPDLVRGIIVPHLPDISDKDLCVMIDDCDFQERMHLYGDDRIDKPGWIRWKEILTAEKKRREGRG